MERRKKFLELLGGKCVNCGSKDNLEFDHLDPDEKEFKISKILDWNEANVEKEVKKCQLLCKPCHHIKTKENKEYGAEAEHGTLWRYRKYSCRCKKCIKANEKYNLYRRTVDKIKNS